MFLRHTITIDIPQHLKQARFADTICLTGNDEIVIMLSNGVVGVLLHYDKQGRFVKMRRFEEPMQQGLPFGGDELLVMLPKEMGIGVWNVATGEMRRMGFKFRAKSIFAQKLHHFPQSNSYAIQQRLTNNPTTLTFLKFPTLELSRLTIDPTLTITPLNQISKICYYKKLCSRLDLTIYDFVTKQTSEYFIELEGQCLVRAVKELREEEILVFCADERAKQKLLVFNIRDQKVRRYAEEVVIQDNIFDVQVSGPIVYIFTIKNRNPLLPGPGTGSLLLLDRQTSNLLLTSPTTLAHTHTYTFHGGCTRHFLIELKGQRIHPKRFEIDFCRKVSQKELYVWMLKQIGGWRFRRDMVEYVVEAFAEEEDGRV